MMVLLNDSFLRCLMTLAVVVAPFMVHFEYRPKPDHTTSGWSSPAPLVFETAKPRSTAQTSGTFFTLGLSTVDYFDVLPPLILSLVTFVKSYIQRFSLSELQRWQL
jgi:hypothetical protein